MSETKRRRWLYIDPSRSKKKERAKVKTSASFSHFNTITETATSDAENQCNGQGSLKCRDTTKTGYKPVPDRGQRTITHSNSFSDKTELVTGQTVIGNCQYADDKGIFEKDTLRNNNKTVIQNGRSGHSKKVTKIANGDLLKPNSSALCNNTSNSDSSNKVMHLGNESQHSGDSYVGAMTTEKLTHPVDNNYNTSSQRPLTEKRLNGGFTNTDRRAVTSSNSSNSNNNKTGISRREGNGGVRDKIKLWSRREEAQKVHISPPQTDKPKHPLVIANHGVLPDSGYCGENKQDAKHMRQGAECQVETAVNSSKVVKMENAESNNKISGVRSTSSTGDYDELDDILVQVNSNSVKENGQVIQRDTDQTTGHQSAPVDSDSDGEQASSQYVEYFVHCNGTVIKQKNAAKDQSKPDRSGSPVSYTEQSSRNQVDYQGISSPSANGDVGQSKWSTSSAPPPRYRLNDCSEQLSSSTSDMLQRFNHRPELDTLSVRDHSDRSSKSRKLKSLFKSNTKEPGRLNKHISWGTINEHFDDYPIPPKVKHLNNDYPDTEDDEVFSSVGCPKKSMSLNLTPGFLNQQTSLNTHENLESPNSIGSASSLLQSEDELSSCLDTLSNRSMDSDQQDSALDTLSNHSWCSDQLDSSGCFTSSSLSQFSDYTEVGTKQKRTKDLDPRQTKSNLDLVEIMSTFSDILDVSLESLQSQKLLSDNTYTKRSSQWDSQSHTGFVSYSSEKRRITPAVSFGCETELQKQYQPFGKRLTETQSMDFGCHNGRKWDENKGAISELDVFSDECDSLLGVSGFQRSDSTETITEELVGDLQTSSEHLQETSETNKFANSSGNSHVSNHKYIEQQHTRAASVDFTTRNQSSSNFNKSSVDTTNTSHVYGSDTPLSGVTNSKSCYELSHQKEAGNDSRIRGGHWISSKHSSDGYNERDTRKPLAPERTEASKSWQQKQQHSLALSGITAATPIEPSVHYQKPRLMHSTSHASGLSKDPLGDWSSLQEALSELDPHFSFSQSGRERDDTLNSCKTRAASVGDDRGRSGRGINGTVTELQQGFSKERSTETVKQDHPNPINGLESDSQGLNNNSQYDNKGSQSVSDLSQNDTRVSRRCIDLNTNGTEAKMNGKTAVDSVTNNVMTHSSGRHSMDTYSETHMNRQNGSLMDARHANINTVTHQDSTSRSFKTVTMSSSVGSDKPSGRFDNHRQQSGQNVSSKVSVDPPKTITNIGKPRSTDNNKHQSESMSLATLLRIRSTNFKTEPKQNGLRKFKMSDIKESSPSEIEMNTAETEGDVAMEKSPTFEPISPEEQDQLDLLLQSLDF